MKNIPENVENYLGYIFQKFDKNLVKLLPKSQKFLLNYLMQCIM